MNNILITGANGQLGHCLHDLCGNDPTSRYFYTDVAELDITDAQQVNAFVEKNNIDVIINAAGYTAVDKAESDVERCYLINRDATKILAEVSALHHCFFVHISTDYVFEGSEDKPHRPGDAINPQSVYGKSKAEGEAAIAEAGCHSVIIRTSWLYSEYGANFVKTMLRLGNEKTEIGVVADQLGGPTYAGDLAKAILVIVKNRRQFAGLHIYHFANKGKVSWCDFARQIMENAGLPCKVVPLKTSEYKTAARRPAFSVFDLSDIENDFGIEIPEWSESLKKCMQIIKNQ
ncbi:MAG: dTDP-4-dehydrorhamnose reductase [Bacteroidales bacterium]|nr:dTDP-4-dehydrorhamnose reductase [Bacteroidales bacterium]